MNLILLTNTRGRLCNLSIQEPRFWIPALLTVVSLVVGLVYGGYTLGYTVAQNGVERLATGQDEAALGYDQRLETLQQESEERIAALQARVGRLQAHIIRLDALGHRLARVAELEDGEFDFAMTPAVGGAVRSAASDADGDFLASLGELDRGLAEHEARLSAMQQLFIDRSLRERILPTARPVDDAWISSYFGMRTDPFTGRREHHDGIDFAAWPGTHVTAAADGVVIFSGRHGGYGNMVEINHGNGYTTRYAHNRENLVAKGEMVERGDKIAKVGATGRATGPHLHFEVLRDGTAVNPTKFLAAQD